MKFILSWRRWLVFLLACTSALALSSCNPSDFRTKATQVSQLVFATPSGPSTFNPPLNQSAFSVFGFIYNGLLTQNGLTGELEPALAQSWQISEDRKSIVFTLRPTLKWSDGHPFTVDDILFTFQDIYLNPKIPSNAKIFSKLGLIELYLV